MFNYTKSAAWATGIHLSNVVSMLLRNIIFARLLSPEDFSIALTFGIVLSLFEYISNFGHENLMQRSRDGDLEGFQATMHSVMIMRGVAIAFIIILIAPNIPILLKLSETSFNYAYLAIVPLITGFSHLDPQRLHRQNDFTLSAKISITADISSVLVALTCVLIWNSYWAFYFSFIFRHSVSTFLSHLWSIRPYRLSLAPTYLKNLWLFGLPLILVGVLKYFGTEIDKALIIRYSGLAHFTLYFLAMMLTSSAANIISIGLSKIFIRRISLANESNHNHIAHGNGVVFLYLVLPLLLTITAFGELIIHLVFGEKYPALDYLVPSVVTLIGLRQVSQWLNQIIIGGSKTKFMLFADTARIIVLMSIILFTISSKDVRLFALTFAVSELGYILLLTQLLEREKPGIKFICWKLLAATALAIVCFWLFYLAFNTAPLVEKSSYYLFALMLLVSLFNVFSLVCRQQTKQLLATTKSLITMT